MELLDVLDENGNLTGRAEERKIVHEQGLWHIHVGVWIMNQKGELLFQKRSPNKIINPNKWTRTGGHVDSGETPIKGIQRETEEEIGVKNFGGIYIQSNTELCEYLIKVIGAFQSEDTEENKILLEVFLSYVFDNKVLEVAYKQDVNTSNMFKQLLEERFVRVSNELIEKMWAKIDTQEFVNKILTKNYTLYSIDNWSRKNDSI
mgnify:CR=1 FL=1